MSGARIPKLEALLERVLDLPVAERAAFLERLGAEDPEGERMLRRSLAGPDSGFLVPPGDTRRVAAMAGGSGAKPLLESDLPGDRVGPYELVRVLGSGGMGSVWLAERVDGLMSRQVALKLPRLWLPGILDQLTRERDILAALEHPHIARLYDAGVTAGGRPYLAIEHVDGETIDDYCRRRAAPVAERVRLVVQVAGALAYAHARLVIHRDIKPSNILVGRDGHARLLDFGIARLLGGPADNTTVLGGRALTPGYASPEQIAGERLSVATDVYSLGVVAYELLAGERPYALRETGAAALARELAGVRLVAPSERAASREVARALRGDLDVIVLKALARDPAERYPTVDALAADLERHRAGEPVRARAASRWYRAVKLLRRHRLAFALAALAAVTVAGGTAVSWWQAGVARAEARRAERVSSFVAQIFTEAVPRNGAGGAVTAADLLGAAAERLATLDEEPRVAAELGVLIAEAFEALGDTARGLPAARLAAERATAALGPRDPLALRARYMVLAGHDARGEYDDSARLADPLIADARAALPASAKVLAETLSSRSFGLAKKDQAEASIALLEQAIAVAEEHLGRHHEVTIVNLGLLGNTHGRFGDHPRQLAAAGEALRRASEAHGARRPHVVLTKAERWFAEALLFNQRPAEAAPILERVLADQRRLDTVDTPRVRAALQRLAETYHAIGRLDRALPLIREVQELEERLGAVPADDRLALLASAARLLSTAGRLDEALRLLDRHAALAREVGAPRRPVVEVRRARALVWLGRDEGDRLAAALVAEQPPLAAPLVVDALVVRAQHARRRGRAAAALELAREALRRAAGDVTVGPYERAVAHCEVALAALDLGDRAAAAAEVDRGFIELARAQVPPSPLSTDCRLARDRLAAR